MLSFLSCFFLVIFIFLFCSFFQGRLSWLVLL